MANADNGDGNGILNNSCSVEMLTTVTLTCNKSESSQMVSDRVANTINTMESSLKQGLKLPTSTIIGITTQSCVDSDLTIVSGSASITAARLPETVVTTNI